MENYSIRSRFGIKPSADNFTIKVLENNRTVKALVLYSIKFLSNNQRDISKYIVDTETELRYLQYTIHTQ